MAVNAYTGWARTHLMSVEVLQINVVGGKVGLLGIAGLIALSWLLGILLGEACKHAHVHALAMLTLLTKLILLTQQTILVVLILLPKQSYKHY